MSDVKKKPFYKKWWFIGIVVIVLIGAIANMGDDGVPASNEQTNDAEQAQGTESNKSEEPKEDWKEVIIFEGESIKDTETFHIEGKEWRIVWSTEPGDLGDMNFQIYAYDSDQNMKSVAANVVGKANDTSTIRGDGDYYLSINTAQPYKIIIEEYK